MYNKNLGFTLIELMMVVVVAAILLAIALPSFDSTLRNMRLTTGVNDLISSLHLARTEATKRGVPVAVCRTDSPNADRPVCGSGSSWTEGWMVFADNDDTGHLSAGEEIIAVHGALHEKLKISAHSSFNESVIYQANGFAELDGEPPRYFIYCDDKDDDLFSRVLAISNSGRPQIIPRDESYAAPPSCSS